MVQGTVKHIYAFLYILSTSYTTRTINITTGLTFYLTTSHISHATSGFSQSLNDSGVGEHCQRKRLEAEQARGHLVQWLWWTSHSHAADSSLSRGKGNVGHRKRQFFLGTHLFAARVPRSQCIAPKSMAKHRREEAERLRAGKRLLMGGRATWQASAGMSLSMRARRC